MSKKTRFLDKRVLKGIGAGCDKEAVRVLMNSPKWIPGEHSGQKMIQNILFKLPG